MPRSTPSARWPRCSTCNRRSSAGWTASSWCARTGRAEVRDDQAPVAGTRTLPGRDREPVRVDGRVRRVHPHGRDHGVSHRVDCDYLIVILEPHIDPRAVPRRPDAVWQFADLEERKIRREQSWSIEGWADTVHKTVPLIQTMKSRMGTVSIPARICDQNSAFTGLIGRKFAAAAMNIAAEMRT